jgi:hypothetical protein
MGDREAEQKELNAKHDEAQPSIEGGAIPIGNFVIHGPPSWCGPDPWVIKKRKQGELTAKQHNQIEETAKEEVKIPDDFFG